MWRDQRMKILNAVAKDCGLSPKQAMAALGMPTEPRMEVVPSDDGPAHVYIYEPIDSWWMDVGGLVRDIQELETDEITLHLNTPGGVVWDGMAIYNALARHPAKITSLVEGIAASMGSVIALAGDEVVMEEGAMYMVHNPMGVTVGDANEMRAYADLLDKIGENIKGIYQRASGQGLEQITAWMDAETFMTADEAVQYGFADKANKKHEQGRANARAEAAEDSAKMTGAARAALRAQLRLRALKAKE